MNKNIVILILIIGVLFLLLLRKCEGGGGVTETTKYDTVYVPVKADTFYIPQPVTHYLPGKVPKALEKWDTLYMVEDIDTAAILQDYYSFNLYSDTLKNKYGYVLVSDTISRNKVLGRGVKTDLLIPEVTRTVIKILPPKNQVYIGAAVLGNPKDFLSGYEVNLSLKTKQDRIVELGYDQLFNSGGYFKIGYRHKISFKNQK